MKFILITLSILSINSYAHSGGTDSYGCHNNRKTGDYHCHNPKNTDKRKSPAISRTDKIEEKELELTRTPASK